MIHFISFNQAITNLVHHIVPHPAWHGKWLNTLSYLENCGARKIASCEHPTAVREEMLKHAAEEFRHAFYLKKQLNRIGQRYEDYQRSHLLGGWSAYHYINRLDLHIAKHLQTMGLCPLQIKPLSYLLVTYAIELRAGELYPIYQATLKQHQSKVVVQSILLEEEEHLEEMEKALSQIPDSQAHIEAACRLESRLFECFLQACLSDLQLERRLKRTEKSTGT
jgi:bacterioferritin (cytochrome b1)